MLIQCYPYLLTDISMRYTIPNNNQKPRMTNHRLTFDQAKACYVLLRLTVTCCFICSASSRAPSEIANAGTRVHQNTTSVCAHALHAAPECLRHYPEEEKQSINIICDMIKRNDSDVGHVVLEILAKTVFKFLCFIVFLALTNSL